MRSPVAVLRTSYMAVSKHEQVPHASHRRTAASHTGNEGGPEVSAMFSHETSAELARILEGVLVSQTLPGSPAERAGVRPGDIILSVNGQRTRSLDDYLAALDAAPIEIVVDVFRSGDRLTLSWSLARDRSAGPASSDPRLRN